MSAMNCLKSLDLSSNLIDSITADQFQNLSNLEHLDLSYNSLASIETNLSFFKMLKSLKLSRIDFEFNVECFTGMTGSEDIDFSYNNLSLVSNELLNRFEKLKKINLKETNLMDFKFMENLIYLQELDLSNNRITENIAKYLISKDFNILKISNISLGSFKRIEKILDKLEYLDISYNGLSKFEYLLIVKMNKLKEINLSFNEISSFDDYLRKDNLIKYFVELKYLKYVNFTQCFTQKLENLVYFFNKNLEVAVLSGNMLKYFSKFCVEDDYYYECELKVLYLNSNQIKKIKKIDLFYLENLEYLNLDNNLISSFESESFISLINLETLILSSNKIRNFNSSNKLFNGLINLKYLNLSSNRLTYLNSYLFDNLNKLEVIDLSNNLIYTIKEYTFNMLTSLKDLYINTNSTADMIIEMNSFNRLDSITNVYICKSILNNSLTKFIFKDMIKKKNRLTSTSILKREYYKSFNLISVSNIDSIGYDCELTLTFIKYNIHFNLKTESDFYDYLISCNYLYLPLYASKNFFIQDFNNQN